jgi:DNA-directed RNA polymerase specialized sigma24 family protein
MRSPEAFDAFYAGTRERLLLETYALTGDLPAARTAVRDAFAVAWHHWPKVARLDDPEAWVRPHAHSRALHRHAARPWHRDKGVDANVRATLEALGKLSSHERKALVLTTLSPLSLADIAREVGLPQAETERALQRATSRFAMSRAVASTDVRLRLDALRAPLIGTRWPRSTIIRRTGTARRRTHTLIGSAAVVAALLVSGTVVASGGAEPSTLDQENAFPGVTLREASAGDPPALDDAHLLTTGQVERYGRGLTWSEGETSDNLAGSGLVMPCQQTRFADPAGAGALMRSFTGTAEVTKKKRTGKGRKARTIRRTVVEERATAVEFVELSADDSQAHAAFETTRGWYADCLDARVQLVSTDTVAQIGDEATVLTLRTWNKTPSRIAVGLARTGQLTVTTLVRSTGAPVPARSAAAGLAAAVNATCGTPGAGACAGPPRLRSSEPYPVGKPSGLLSAVDLPPVTGAIGPWVGTDPERARVNFAATRCDNTQFRGKGMKHPLTRTFLFPARKKVDTFGLTQTVATMKTAQARRFVDEVRNRIRRCGQANLGTSVDTLVNRSGKNAELTVWDLDVEISDNRTIQFWMAIMRDGNAVSQVGFTPAEGMTMARDDFTVTAERALERLSDLPGAKR